ncbi:hypothetical protein NBE98_04760 [Clostridium swellfunianum]|uniref:hypothetical protein n=1 Tax=Clostridium swellfunianum TaxID=1367462 RepID=UPI00202F1F20|nr:hypothetical protein [Clostridium swellfunianum]MCM0647686.1 hypothetical protein [Clostridium swellfunianum]
MKHEKLKISKMVGELMNYLFYMGATNINIDCCENDGYFKIVFTSNFEEESTKKIEKLTKLLKSNKREEIEEYYWALAGDSDVANELSLVGMMVDESKVQYEGRNIKITLYRYKE